MENWYHVKMLTVDAMKLEGIAQVEIYRPRIFQSFIFLFWSYDFGRYWKTDQKYATLVGIQTMHSFGVNLIRNSTIQLVESWIIGWFVHHGKISREACYITKSSMQIFLYAI